jgi:hypothetical protein
MRHTVVCLTILNIEGPYGPSTKEAAPLLIKKKRIK